jgi:hypothetical protein
LKCRTRNSRSPQHGGELPQDFQGGGRIAEALDEVGNSLVAQQFDAHRVGSDAPACLGRFGSLSQPLMHRLEDHVHHQALDVVVRQRQRLLPARQEVAHLLVGQARQELRRRQGQQCQAVAVSEQGVVDRQRGRGFGRRPRRHGSTRTVTRDGISEVR